MRQTRTGMWWLHAELSACQVATPGTAKTHYPPFCVFGSYFPFIFHVLPLSEDYSVWMSTPTFLMDPICVEARGCLLVRHLMPSGGWLCLPWVIWLGGWGWGVSGTIPNVCVCMCVHVYQNAWPHVHSLASRHYILDSFSWDTNLHISLPLLLPHLYNIATFHTFSTTCHIQINNIFISMPILQIGVTFIRAYRLRRGKGMLG